jgi:membrane fusion protein, copper/silver efflux system
MNERNLITNSNEGSDMLGTEHNNYRRAFWIALTATIVLTVVASVLWWRLSHNGTASQTGAASASESTGAMAQTSSAKGSGSEQRAEGDAQAGTMQEMAQETPLAPIQLTPQRMQSIGVQIGEVKYQPVNDEIRFYGNVQADERRLAYVQTRFAGWIRKLYADATGDFVRKGQPLFTIYSPDLVSTEQEYLIAKKNQASLQQSSVTGVASGAASLFGAAKDRLLQWEIPASEIAKLDTTGKVITDLTINSPVSGYITEKNALPNMYVQPETHLYTVSDLSEVWVLAQVFQSDAGKIKPGDHAEVTVDAYPGKMFLGRVDYLLPQVDTLTRTLPVRLVIPNPGLKLRPGMYVNVRLKQSLGKQLVVPGSAVFHSGTRSLVFAYRGDGNIEPREVELGSRVGEQQIVAKGVHAGEQIVTSANFLIDSEAQLQAAAGAFIPPPPGSGGAAPMKPPAQTQATVELTTDPSPPHKGSNTVRVKLTSPSGQPVTGAQVTVTFFMAGMPDMRMSAMKTVINASDKGPGMYEGTGDLGSGGTWQVTVIATQNGQAIASKQLTVSATGGM